MRIFIGLFVFLFVSTQLIAQVIDPDLLKNTNSIILNNSTTINTNNSNGYEMIVEVKTLLLNKKAKDEANITIPYDHFSSAEFIQGAIKDKQGEIIKKIKKKDFSDYSAVSGFSLFEDSRALHYSYEPVAYPVIIEYAFKIKNKHTFFTFFFSPIEKYGQSVLQAKFVINSEPDKAFHYKSFGTSDPKIIKNSDQTSYTWEFNDMPALKWEPFAVDINSIRKGVLVAPVEFQYEGFAGSNESWVSLGNWVHQLQEGRHDLPESAKTDLKKISETYQEPYERAKAIYEYMQSKTRYVSIQLGIGGFQPFDALTVHELGYGDCKALTNYTQALMKEAGIESYYTLVKAGNKAYDFEESFTANQFNHVILCLPIDKDTIWMECTNQQIPFGFLGDFTDNRPALLIKENASALVKTPHYDKRHNQSYSTAVLTLEPNGNARIVMERSHKGLHYDNISYYPSLEPRDIKKRLGNGSGWKNYTIDQVQISIEKSRIPQISLSYQVDVLALGTTSGNRIFIPASPMNTYEVAVPKVRSRQTPFTIYHDEIYSDTLLIKLPESYYLEQSVDCLMLESAFGLFIRDIKVKEDQLVVIRTLNLNSGSWEANQYDAFYDFREKINRYDQQKLILIKKE